jgi:hypothetical protein
VIDVEYVFQHRHDEPHRREVIVDKHHPQHG